MKPRRKRSLAHVVEYLGQVLTGKGMDKDSYVWIIIDVGRQPGDGKIVEE